MQVILGIDNIIKEKVILVRAERFLIREKGLIIWLYRVAGK